MPWDEPKKDGDDNPWNKQTGQQPPDLTELFKRISDGLGGGSGSGDWNPKSISLFVAAALTLWVLSGIYIINEGQRGVELRFGAYSQTTLPGPHWHFPYPIETVEKVDVDRVRSAQTKSDMLTQDENIVEVELAVQYRVKDAANYKFNVRNPDVPEGRPDQSRGTLFQVMESALREVVGTSKMDFVLGEGRAEIASRIKSRMTDILDEYRSGMEVVTVNLQQSQPPAAVQGAFADAIKAREDEVRFINEAEAYANGIVPQARGEAARVLEAASAYKEKVINNSEGEAQRFLDINKEYVKAPDVTRKRLYLQALESVLAASNKVVVDVDEGNNVFYLPLDRMMRDATRMPREKYSDEVVNSSAKDVQSQNRESDVDDVVSRIRDTLRGKNLRRNAGGNDVR